MDSAERPVVDVLPELRIQVRPVTTLVERLAPHLYGVIMHPGDEQTEPFPVMSPLAGMSAVTMPKGMAEDVAEENGLPHTDFARLWLEAVIALIESEGVTLIDNDKLADLQAAAAAKEHRRNELLQFHTPCGASIRAMARGFDTGHVELPCSMVNHECKAH